MATLETGDSIPVGAVEGVEAAKAVEAGEPSAADVRSLDQLEADLVSRSTRMNAEEYVFLRDLREFDLRQGWRAYRFNGCAEWLNYKCGFVPGAAREKLRVAHQLFTLPRVSEAFRQGQLSYSKARALTRVADAHNEAALVDYALEATALQVERHCGALRNARRDISTADANRAHRTRCLTRSIHGDGSMSIHVDLPREAGELVMKALERAMDEAAAETEHDPDPEEESFFARQVDALVRVAQAYLSGSGGERRSSAEHYQVLVHVDEAALRDAGGRSDLPVETVRRIACDASLVAITEDSRGEPLHVGRKRRVVPPALKRALLARDAHCRFPGCTHERWLDAHHVVPWADGGETSLANTLLLCSRHHRMLHEGGYSVTKSAEGRWSFRTAEGKVIPEARPCRPGADLARHDASRDARRRSGAARGVNGVEEPVVPYVAIWRNIG